MAPSSVDLPQHTILPVDSDAVNCAPQAVQLRYGLPAAHRILCASLAQAGQVEEARSALSTCDIPPTASEPRTVISMEYGTEVSVDEAIARLRASKVPITLIDLADKLYRLYKLNKLDNDLQDLRRVSGQTIRDLNDLVTRVQAGELRLNQLEAAVQEHRRILVELQKRLPVTHLSKKRTPIR